MILYFLKNVLNTTRLHKSELNNGFYLKIQFLILLLQFIHLKVTVNCYLFVLLH